MSTRSIFSGPLPTRNSSPLVRFPARHSRCVWILREDTAWLVLAGDHGWLHGDHHTVRADAQWLAQNLGLPVRSAAA